MTEKKKMEVNDRMYKEEHDEHRTEKDTNEK